MKPKRILLYYPPNKRSVAIETLCRAVKDAGHEMRVLTLTEKDAFHTQMEKLGIAADSTVLKRKPSWKYFLNQARFLIRYCRTHKIDYVWSHLQEASTIALLAQRFMKARVVVFRHHAESAFYAEYGELFGMQRNKNEIRIDQLINRIARLIVVPSSGVWEGMKQYEKCNMTKVKLIPYIYDFSTYDQPDAEKVAALRRENEAKLLLIMVSRFVASKQHRPVFEVIAELVKEGLDIKMIVMDDGPLKADIETFTKEQQLEDRISFVGYRKDFINFMAAADLLMHPSLTEASNNVTKEMGLLGKPCAVCKDVGDFNDYFRDGENGFLMRRDHLKEEIRRVILAAYNEHGNLGKMGTQLRTDVLEKFGDTPANRQRYIDLIQ